MGGNPLMSANYFTLETRTISVVNCCVKTEKEVTVHSAGGLTKFCFTFLMSLSAFLVRLS